MAQEQLFRRPFYAKDGKTRLPQYVAHRGFNRIYPENTKSAFTAAIDVGCHGIETDVQITKDGVVVISHDSSLNRCFGIDKLIKDCDWEYLSTLWTTREPRERMLRLSDLLDFLNAPSNAHVWVLLDIKRNNDVKVIIKKIAEVVKSGPYASQPWYSRIVLGCWTPAYFPSCKEHLPDFQAALIGYNVVGARNVLHTVPSISFNTHFKSVKGPLGYGFVDAVHGNKNSEDGKRKLIFTWTVNAARDMRWAIRNNFDAILTDDPALCKQICDSWDDAYAQRHEADDNRVTLGERLHLALWGFWFTFFSWVFPIVYPYLQRFMQEKPTVRTEINGSTSRT
ncbi:hypothetical protein UA08_01765 [Talaromyces atroroseus]|uniref:GP-PDE domain-containing protein n=1 Tax=Talaromyces atroroseus TaxID=1441469 RepID=A0A1Q5QAH4_TALAT|nr:hypothetical protein UA08_01765 [Talaromyces atroroseus]OKL62947.1 hypothetical protein UA08_01765 [Talaromyces atroroseus]